MQAELRRIAREFLGGAEVEGFLGWTASAAGGTRPALIRSPAQSGSLVWSDRCYANLTTYLPRLAGLAGRLGIAVKGCDARALRELVRSRQVDRDRLFVVGVPCSGLAGRDGSLPASRCRACTYPADFEYDAVVGPMEAPDLPPSVETPEIDWLAEVDKCIRCDACRKICYGCFCPECIFESTQPRWLSRSDELGEKLFYHAVRAYHLAGRCVGCDECHRACPAGVRLDLLNRTLRDDLAELFGFSGAGVREEPPPLVTFDKDDRDPYPGGGA